jgi:GNAT superfamily N-acetyltransferase
MRARVRPASLGDVDEMNRLQHGSYPPSLHEQRDVLAAIVKQGMSFVVDDADATTGTLVAYALVHGIRDPADPPRLNTAETANTADRGYGGHVFIHDVCVQPESRSQRIASSLAALVLREACVQGAPSVTLIAVQGSRLFWERHGFTSTVQPTTGGAQLLSSTHVQAAGFRRKLYAERVHALETCAAAQGRALDPVALSKHRDADAAEAAEAEAAAAQAAEAEAEAEATARRPRRRSREALADWWKLSRAPSTTLEYIRTHPRVPWDWAPNGHGVHQALLAVSRAHNMRGGSRDMTSQRARSASSTLRSSCMHDRRGFRGVSRAVDARNGHGVHQALLALSQVRLSRGLS